ncbi:SPOR domain-containing protein [Siccirubricoccus sp. KC 17139]|uniref:SPOR domain-containing protein n=1 Tax=Siccirubricoccus soli TaxID=2899147 RepID=A0ABT1DAW3_9PROT|nr:SPOR domain-containing protein [Siccirubricoccus soli]MCO6419081.1 SPOR domain-containing protein [Siccirubricoccus soli]MCP2685216.1 SPOR domain-containing protein [Siccirubricoccus soli]
MTAEPLLPQRRLLRLPLLLALSTGVAGWFGASLALRRAPPAPSPTCLVRAQAECPPLEARLRSPDAMTTLEAALGQRPAPRAEAGVFLAGLLAGTPSALAMPAAAAPGLAPPPASTGAAPGSDPAAARPGVTLPGGYALDLGYFLVPEQAEAFAARLAQRGLPVQMLPVPDASGGIWTHIRTPPFAGSAEALEGADRIEREFGLAAALVPPAVVGGRP